MPEKPKETGAQLEARWRLQETGSESFPTVKHVRLGCATELATFLEGLVSLIADWRDGAKRLLINYPPDDQSAMGARVLRRCADELDSMLGERVTDRSERK